MGIPRFVKLPTHRRFNYSPRYWDPEKEEREVRIRQIKQEFGVEMKLDPNRSTITRGSIRQASQKVKVKASKTANIRLAIILAVLLLLAYLLFYR